MNPARSHQRRYMRISIWAQSCDSVPPAPGWMETIAGLGVVRARQHDLELELVQLAAQAAGALGDLGVEAAVVAGLLGQLEQDGEVVGLGGQLADPADGARQLGALADQLLGAAVVLPEGRRAHLGVERGQPLLLAGRGQRCLRSSSTRRASSATSRLNSPSITRLLRRRARRPSARRHRQRQPGQPVAEPRVQRRPCAQRHAVGHDPALVELQAADDLAGGRDERRDAGVGRAHHGDAVLDRPERVHRQMLRRAARAPEPARRSSCSPSRARHPSRTRERARGRYPRNRSRRRTGLAGPETRRRGSRAPDRR